jgi:hypothetical protein
MLWSYPSCVDTKLARLVCGCVQSVSIVPLAVSALCVNAAGLAQMLSLDLLPRLLRRVLGAEGTPASRRALQRWASWCEELMRHHPQLRPLVLGVVVDVCGALLATAPTADDVMQVVHMAAHGASAALAWEHAAAAVSFSERVNRFFLVRPARSCTPKETRYLRQRERERERERQTHTNRDKQMQSHPHAQCRVISMEEMVWRAVRDPFIPLHTFHALRVVH